MGKTGIEKILSLNSEEEVKPGKIIWIDLTFRTARDFGGANVVKNFKENYPQGKVQDPSRTFFTFDCNVPANTIPYANNQMICRNFALEQGMPLYDVDAGIGSHILFEKKIIKPGDTVVGTDSHLNLLGALSVFGQGMGDIDIAFAFKTGKTWFEVPKSMKIELKGKLSYPATAKDLILTILGNLGSDGALDFSIDFTGDAIENLKIDERITIASMVTEMAGIIGLFPVNGEVEEYFKDKDFEDVNPDPDASYEKSFNFDLSGVVPSVALPGSPSKVVPVKEVAGEKINSVFIGSCTNGRYSDIHKVAEILKGKKVAKGVMLKIVPATRYVWGELLKSGDLQILYDAGAIVSHPGCGGCASGQIGMTGKGEVQVSTSNRNFKGKQGDGDTYLASPVVAAYSALKGEIAYPEG
ncbi:MAG: aconitase/3-isopropylmalate dehydratase large subunit family protein [Thermoanaerobaculia bacterium]